MKFCIASTFTLLALLPLAAGCAASAEDEPLSHDQQAIATSLIRAQGSMSVANTAAGIPTLALSGDELSVSAAVHAQLSAADLFLPHGCVVVVPEGNTVTYTFDACAAGPWGPVLLSGTETADFSVSPDRGTISASVQGDLKALELIEIKHKAEVDLTAKNGVKQVTISGDISAGTPPLPPIDEKVELTASNDVHGCSSLTGESDTSLGPLGLSLEYDGFVNCGSPKICPLGSIRATTKLTHITVGLDFDGTDEVVAYATTGEKSSLKLDCQQRP